MSADYFTVGSYDLTIQQDEVGTVPDGVTYNGASRGLVLRSAGDAPSRMSAHIAFTANHVPGPGALGFAVGIGTDRIDVFTSVPIGTYDQWLEVLRGERRASFLFIYDDGGEGSSRELAVVKLTTESNPFDMFGTSELQMDKLTPQQSFLLKGRVEPAQ
ncbi:hypothetical protein KOI35_37295 [Actinoplanes bogorensis]|uniref:Uncharacterized protein n=1 Tax=Paractinoplanes bogorensis TaxID=1610840 RepID=A0ABS5Z2L2_9ACTN|nr:hypothetical protein [Actinoplanes bogorensis]MBU2669184.1 hypothetical protein [Actinoplanes bogorensis]